MNTTDSAILLWRTRDTSRHLAQGMTGALIITLITGGALWLRLGHGNLIQLLLLVHLASGVLATLFFLPFIVIHWQDGREPLLHLIWPFRLLREVKWDAYARKRLVGHAFLWVVLLVVLSGLVTAAPAVAYLAGHPVPLPYGGHVPLLAIHRWLTLAVFAGLLWHLPKEERQ